MSSKAPYITKGSKIRAQWFKANNPPSSLAGMQLKFGMTQHQVVGTCRHFRADDPVNPTIVMVYVDPDGPSDLPLVHPYGCTCPTGHVEINGDWIVGVLSES